MKKNVIQIFILLLFIGSLYAQKNHKMEFSLQGMQFDSLQLAAYNWIKRDVELIHAMRNDVGIWSIEVPDSIWNSNDRFVLGKSDEKSKIYEYICFHDTFAVKKQMDVSNRVGIYPDGNQINMEAFYVNSDTVQSDNNLLIYHNFTTIPKPSSGAKAMITYPDFSTFTKNEYRYELATYVSAVKDCPNSKFLAQKLFNNLNKYHSSQDAKQVFFHFSENIKKSNIGIQIEKSLLKDWTLFENDSLINVITNNKEKITHEGINVKLICFTASWCTNCRKEIPLLKEIYNDLKDESFEIVYISVDQRDDQKSLFRKQIQEDKIPWRSLFSYPEKIEDKYMIRVYPTNMLVYPDNHTEFIDVRIQEDKEKLYRLVKNRISELINH